MNDNTSETKNSSVEQQQRRRNNQRSRLFEELLELDVADDTFEDDDIIGQDDEGDLSSMFNMDTGMKDSMTVARNRMHRRSSAAATTTHKNKVNIDEEMCDETTLRIMKLQSNGHNGATTTTLKDDTLATTQSREGSLKNGAAASAVAAVVEQKGSKNKSGTSRSGVRRGDMV